MNSDVRAILSSWPLGAWTICALALTSAVYLRGYRALRRAGSARIGPGGPIAFCGGLIAIFIALESPIEPLASLLLTMHMAQHLLLILVAAPLIVLAAPEVPLLLGLPHALRSYWIVPLIRSREARALGRWLTRASVAWVLSTLAVWIWHVPVFYDLALRDPRWHYLEHACFVITAVLFWWVVIEPYPTRPRGDRWILLPYLFLAGVQGGVLAALLTFADRVVYQHYAAMPRLWGISAIGDQAAAGGMMWVAGIVGYLVPAMWIAARLLYGDASRARTTRSRTVALPVLQRRRTGPFDLMRAPLIGRFLGWRYARPAMQLVMLMVAAAVVLDGFRGPQIAPLNLAGTLPWIHWRGLLVIGLLAVGNVFCMACPFTLPRRLARRWLPQGRTGPRFLRSKWLAALLLVAFFITYEAADLWARPWWTAVITVGFFVAAFAVDGVFRPGSFCKYVCPIGQFNFVHSLVSPFDVRVRDAAVCSACETRECIRGGADATGCEMSLFVPRKAGGLDCTLCLDCIHGCPHGNIGIVAVGPGGELWRDRLRSGIGRLTRRGDVAAIALLLAFAAFVNAGGMVSPVLEFERRLGAGLGLSSRPLVVIAFYVVALIALPLSLLLSAASASRRLGGDGDKLNSIVVRYSLAFVPIGFGMWLAHYGFHLATSASAVAPAAGRFLAELGVRSAGAADLVCNCCARPDDWLLRAELIALDAGLMGSLYAAYRIAAGRHADFGRRVGAVVPWAALLLVLFAAGIWIVFQPMEMRGTMGGGV